MLGNRGIPAAAHALVHASAPGCDRLRHATFLAHTLLVAFAGLAVAPFFLAFHGAPSPAQSLLFALTLAPASAVVLVAGSGALARGHLVTSLGLALAALVLFFGLKAGAATAIAWLAAAAIEAAAARDPRVTRLGGGVAAASVLLVLGLSSLAAFAPATTPADLALLTGAAAVPAGLALVRLCAAPDAQSGEPARDDKRRAALESILPGIVLDLDGDGTVRTVSAAEGILPSAPADGLLGRGLFDRVQVGDRPTFLKLIDDAAHGAQAARAAIRLRIDDVEAATHHPLYATMELRARGIASDGDEASARRVVAVLLDVSDSSDQLREIELARRTVEEALAAKDRFLTTMSHELRTPLNAIIGFSEILASRTTRPDDVAKQCEFARIINQSGQHLLGVVNDVLDISRLQCGTFPINPEAFDLAGLIRQSLDAAAGRAKEAAITLERDCPQTLEEVVADRKAIRQILAALLGNAVKFTPPGGKVSLAVRPEGNGIAIVVADTGYGIAPDDLARLGEPFFQAGGAMARPFEGAGLGLALARGLVGLHGGSLVVESESGHGTSVTLRLPLDCRTIAGRTADAAIEVVARRHGRLPPPPRIKDAA